MYYVIISIVSFMYWNRILGTMVLESTKEIAPEEIILDVIPNNFTHLFQWDPSELVLFTTFTIVIHSKM